MNTGRNSRNEFSRPGWFSRGPKPFALSTAQTSSAVVMTSTKGAAQFSTIRSRSMPL